MQTAACTRRSSFQSAFGRGFNSRHLHQYENPVTVVAGFLRIMEECLQGRDLSGIIWFAFGLTSRMEREGIQIKVYITYRSKAQKFGDFGDPLRGAADL